MNQLDKLEKTELEIFDSRTVQILITEYWHQAQLWFKCVLFAPYIILLLAFWFWETFLLRGDSSVTLYERWGETPGKFISWVILVLCVEQMGVEFI
jgi:hypothetical protein